MTIFISLEESMMLSMLHRLSTAEMEEVVASHQSVAECAVIGINDALRGQIPLALVVTKIHDEIEHFQLEHEIIHMIRQQIGCRFLKKCGYRKSITKTRSGKILRKLMRSIADGRTVSNPSTIDDETIIDEIKSF
jgi:propionyl-CoA synthetase